MKKLIGPLGKMAVLVALLLPCRAYSGDCAEHPNVLLEMKVLSCAPLDQRNAERIGPWHHETGAPLTPEQARVLAGHRGLVIEAKTQRVRNNYFKEAEPWAGPVGPRPWSSGPAKTSYYFYPLPARKDSSAAIDARACLQFKQGALVVLERHTSCECDTGPCFPEENVTVHDVFKSDEQYSH